MTSGRGRLGKRSTGEVRASKWKSLRGRAVFFYYRSASAGQQQFKGATLRRTFVVFRSAACSFYTAGSREIYKACGYDFDLTPYCFD